MEFRIIALGHGVLFGAQYFEKEHEQDFNELSIYLLIVCLNWKWL